MAKIRVLIADDHTLFRESLRILLETEDDIEIVGEAQDGFDATTKAADFRPDVILMDIAMPNISGLIATRSIKNENPSVGILALTMYETEQHIVEMLRAGASGYISKRAPAKELVSAIRAIYEGHAFFDTAIAKKVLDRFKAQIERERGREDSQEYLTGRELELLCLIAEGKTNKEIAEMLSISLHTVQTHRFNLMKKLDLHDRAELVRYAIREGLIIP